MSSGSSTERGRPGRESGFQLWHVYLILSMGGAIWVVVVSRHTHPAALLLISAAIMASGLVGLALNHAFSAFFGAPGVQNAAPVSVRAREALVQEKALVLRSIKELEFDRAMGKISEQDFAELGGRLRERAMTIMEDLDRTDGGDTARGGAEAPPHGGLPGARSPQPAARSPRPVFCPDCGTESQPGAKFCKECGAKL